MKIAHQRKLISKGLRACDVHSRQLLVLSVLGMLAALFKVVSMSLFLPLVYTAFSDSSSPRGRFAVLIEALPAEDINLVYLLAGAILVSGIVGALLAYLTDYHESRLSYHAQTTLSRRVFRRFLSYGQTYLDREGPNAQLRQLRRVPAKVSRQVKVLSRHLRAVFELVVYGAAMLVIAWPAALACFVVLISYYMIFGRLVGWVDSLGRSDDADDDLSENRAADVLLNLPLVKGAGTAQHEKREWRKFQQERFRIRKRASMFASAIKPAKQFLTLLVMLMFVVLLSLNLGALDAYDVVRFVMFFLFLRRMMSAFSKVLEVPADWLDYTQQMDRYFALMERSDKGIVKSGVEVLGRLEESVEISNLVFSYGSGSVLNSLNVTFPLNRCTAVVGLSGSGKSTLLKLLTRQYEIDAGKILLNSQNIGQYTWESLASEIAHLGSEPQFFNKSIEYNLSYGLDKVTPEEIFAALEQAQAADFIASLDAGLQTTMGQQEQPFSRGQLQRLGIARLLLQRHASLLLLDEATSALDEVTEKSILRLLEALPNTTIIFVTHRTAAIDPQMHVVVFDHGQVVEQGLRDELENKPGSHFSKLCRALPTANSGAK